MKVKVNVDNIPDEYKCLVKEEMQYKDLKLLGTVLIMNKWAKWKTRIFGRKKNEKKKDER